QRGPSRPRGHRRHPRLAGLPLRAEHRPHGRRPNPRRHPQGDTGMKRLILPIIGVIAAGGATYSIASTTPHRQSTTPPSPPPGSASPDPVAGVGVIEASTENIAIGSPLSAIAPRVFVGAGDPVRAGAALFELDPRHLRAERDVRRQSLA